MFPVPDEMEFESKIAGLDPTVIDSNDHSGELAAFSCPERAGPLYEIRDGELPRFRCRVGHAYTAESVLEEKSEVLGSALYLALNTLDESDHVREAGHPFARKWTRSHGGTLRGAHSGSKAQSSGDPQGTDGNLTRKVRRSSINQEQENVQGMWGKAVRAECYKDQSRPNEAYSPECVEGKFLEVCTHHRA